MTSHVRTNICTTGLDLAAQPAPAAQGDGPHPNSRDALPNHQALKHALISAVAAETSGLRFNMWAAIVDRDGVVCAVAFSGADRQSQWPGSRVIAAQKANTANAFSLSSPLTSRAFPHGLALSTANLYAQAQPGAPLYGLQQSNPVDPRVAYRGDPAKYGEPDDPMVGYRIGGVNVFGGGFALYAPDHRVVGGLGVSGDTSCTDHMIGWRVRNLLALDHLQGVGGVSGDNLRPDNIVYDIDGGTSAGGFGHPKCIHTADQTQLPPVRP